MRNKAIKSRSAMLGAMATIGALLAHPAPSRAFTPACHYGVNAHQASNAALDLAAAAGIGWVRFDLNWFQFEPGSKGSFQWGEADRFMNHAASLGLNVFLTVAYSPSWAVAQPCNDADPNELNWCLNRPPLNVNDWTDFLTAALTRFSGTVKHWGLWNEPNLLGFWNGTRPQWVSDILIPGADTVHNLCTDCFVLGPELANLRGANWDADEGTCVAGNCAFNGWNYSLIQILQAAGSYIDIITHHKYADPASDFWKEAVDGEVVVIQIMNGIKEVTDQYGQGQPVWITELGWRMLPDGSNTTAYAASQLTAVYEGMMQIRQGTFPLATNQPWPELDKLFWYDLVDDPNGHSWGLLYADLSIKEPYTAYANVIQALGDCTGTGPGPDAGTQPDASPPSDGAPPTGDGAPPTGDAAQPTVDAANPGADSGGLPPSDGNGGCSCEGSGGQGHSGGPGGPGGPGAPVGLLLLVLLAASAIRRRRVDRIVARHM